MCASAHAERISRGVSIVLGVVRPDRGRTARAELILYDKDGWTVKHDGLAQGFYHLGIGRRRARPAAGGAHPLRLPGQLPARWRPATSSSAPASAAAGPAGASTGASPTSCPRRTKVSAYLGIAYSISTQNAPPATNNNWDIRNGFLQIESTWGDLVIGRGVGLYTLGSIISTINITSAAPGLRPRLRPGRRRPRLLHHRLRGEVPRLLGGRLLHHPRPRRPAHQGGGARPGEAGLGRDDVGHGRRDQPGVGPHAAAGVPGAGDVRGGVRRHEDQALLQRLLAAGGPGRQRRPPSTRWAAGPASTCTSGRSSSAPAARWRRAPPSTSRCSAPRSSTAPASCASGNSFYVARPRSRWAPVDINAGFGQATLNQSALTIG